MAIIPVSLIADRVLRQIPPDEAFAFVVVDEGGRRTWIEAALDGGLTDHAAAKIGEHIVGAVEQDSAITGLSFAVVDEDGRRTWIEATEAGGPSDYAVAALRSALVADTVFASGPDIACSGESLTAGSGGSGTTYPAVLSALTGRTVYNLGVGGETSATIAGRTGGRPWLATVAGNEIPASGGVTVTLAGDEGIAVAPLVGGSAGVNPVTIAGVTGTLSLSSGVYTFTRTTAGDAVPVQWAAPVITYSIANRRADITIMWWGQNGGYNGDPAVLIGQQRATIEALTPLDKRWLVLGIPTGTAASQAAIETALLQQYGRRFVNVRQLMATTAALDEAGITPTSQDTTDIAAGTIPTSLRVDSTHFNAAGYTVLAGRVYDRLQEMGWL
jgi:hypothetical protein